jgi:hypothetical protein
MPRLASLVLAATFVAAGAGVSSAEVVLQSVHWQIGRVEGGRVASWQDVRALTRELKSGDRLRARLILKNDGAGAEEGLLLRYSLVARVVPEDGAPEGSWAVPFSVDEKRVPKVGAGKVIDVPLDAGSAVDLYLRRLARAGWSPDRLKIQVMLEPHRGCKVLQTVEDVLEIGSGAKKP